MKNRRDPGCPADHPGPEETGGPGQADCAGLLAAVRRAEPGEGSGGQASSSPESGSLNGDAKRPGKRQRRRKRSPRVKSQATSPVYSLLGLQAESVWFDRHMFEEAEGAYHRKLVEALYGSVAQTNEAVIASRPDCGPANPETAASVGSSYDDPAAVACSHGDLVACHHVVQAVWVNKLAFDSAESRFMLRPTSASVSTAPRSLALPLPHEETSQRTPDEGYLTLTPTPATPSPCPGRLQQSVNGMPHYSSALRGLLQEVWLEKPLYDHAEACFYQSLHDGPPVSSTSGGSRRGRSHHRGSQEQEEAVSRPVCLEAGGSPTETGRYRPESQKAKRDSAVQDKRAAGGHLDPGHSLRFMLHQDGERIWLDRPRFEAAERRFYEAAALAKQRGSGGLNRPSAASTSPRSSPRHYNIMSAEYLAQEKIWFDKHRYDEAERQYYERMNGPVSASSSSSAPTHTAQSAVCPAGDQSELLSRMRSLELENQSLHKVVEDLRLALFKLESRISVLEKSPAGGVPAAVPGVPAKEAPVQQLNSAAPAENNDDDDDLDLFGSDEEEDEETVRVREQRLKEYAERKAKKPAIIAKSSILLDVKPWDDETDMAKLEECVRSVQADGLVWGSSKLVPVGYGIRKLQIQCVVEDDKVGTDMLEEEITKFEDYVQSVDVAAFNKI
ncbi:eukaryotic translation elongation factor 1 delta b (guanine nucleotide exchange protein) isoform X4 [Lepisosteus oculatus]|uniref:eukaryotic translation elongation factor 1 delta b (guanine nucleotide exchange protein) isoform X4 n=1 Tax=Lepisosteus oculatus TaxID=7918 RepID=UPI00371DBFE0